MSAEPVIHAVLKIAWNDRYVGLVDLRPTIARGRVFSYLQKPKNFEKVQVTEFGHSIEWIDQIDIGADAARRRRSRPP